MEPQDRRSSPRRPIKLAAQLSLGRHNWSCQIADFCAEGLFIRYSTDTGRQLDSVLEREPTPHDFDLMFQEPDSAREHRMRVRRVRAINGAMGVVFSQISTTTIDAMLRLCGSSGEQDASVLRSGSDRGQFILRQCTRAIVQHIEPLMTECFKTLESELQNAATVAISDQVANEMMDAVAQIRARQRPLWHQMVIALESPVKAGRQAAGAAQELSLVDKGEFEDWLTLKVMVTKAETQYRGELLQLRMRLDKLGVINSTGQQNPLGPVLVCDAFRHALEILRFSRAVEKICLRTFEQVVLKTLGELYAELNQLLVRQGILPDLDLSRYLADRKSGKEAGAPVKNPKKPEEKAEAPAEKSPGPQELTTAAPETKPRPGSVAGDSSRTFHQHQLQAQSAFATVRNLLGTLQSGRMQAAEPTFQVAANPLSSGELQRELQGLQVDEARQEAPPEEGLRSRILAQIRSAGDRGLNEEQQASLDVVDRFFGSMLHSPRLGEAARDQLRRLEVPVFKVVLRDPQFFEDEENPVRAVMNRVAELGVKGGRMSSVIQRRVEGLVQRLNTEFEQDTQVFGDVLGELDEMIERQNLVYRRNVERVTAAAEGAQKVEDAKFAVAAEIDRRLSGRKVPKAMISLINGGWRDLLSLTWIRQGADSTLWQDYLSVLDTLLGLGDDPTVPVNLAELLRTIQEGLASISSNHMPSGHIRDELKKFLVGRHDGSQEMIEMPARSESGASAPVGMSEMQQRSLQRWISRAQRLQVGDWLRYQEDPANPQYMRLVWVARELTRFVFVNHQGMKVVERDVTTLAQQLQQGLIVPDPNYDRPIVDESIDRMVKTVYDQLSWASSHDELTGLATRREFERELDRYLERCGHEGDTTLAWIDLRQFRLLNDTAGSAAGDEVLQQVAKRLRGHVGADGSVARLGGDEFAILVPTADAESTLYTLIHEIEGMQPMYGGRTYEISASVGCAASSAVLSSGDRWLKAASEACRLAKRQGNGRIDWVKVAADEQFQRERIAAKIASMGNPDEERILLRAQKIIPLHGETRMGTQYEALISMYDDNGELISTGEFVRMAERYNRMQAVDRWVVGHVLDWLRSRPPGLERNGGVCINLSGHSLNDEELLEFIYHRLSERDAPIERMWFEITEAAAINNLHGVIDFVQELKELGCRFCLGNFGTGATAYEFLRNLPVDLIKIDGSFIRNIHHNETDRVMVRSMVEMAHFMGREVIASQIEDKAALDILRELGVDYGQGYIIEKPKLLSSMD